MLDGASDVAPGYPAVLLSGRQSHVTSNTGIFRVYGRKAVLASSNIWSILWTLVFSVQFIFTVSGCVGPDLLTPELLLPVVPYHLKITEYDKSMYMNCAILLMTVAYTYVNREAPLTHYAHRKSVGLSPLTN